MGKDSNNKQPPHFYKIEVLRVVWVQSRVPNHRSDFSRLIIRTRSPTRQSILQVFELKLF